MEQNAQIIARIEAYCAAAGIALTTFGRLAVNDGKFVRRLAEGKTCTLKTLARVDEYISGGKGPRSLAG